MKKEKMEGGNPYTTRTRLRSKAARALNDLILLAQKLPEDELEQIFTPQLFTKLVASVLGTDSDFIMGVIRQSRGSSASEEAILTRLPVTGGNSDKTLDPRRIELALICTKHGLLKCTRQLRVHEPNVMLTKPLLLHLTDAEEYCAAICSKVQFAARTPSGEEH